MKRPTPFPDGGDGRSSPHWRAAGLLPVLLAGGLPLAAGEFARWRGVNSGGSAGEPGAPLIESWDESRVAWVSEVKSPHPWNYSIVRAKAQWPRTNLGNGGYCLPGVWDGKVYVTYWRPAGAHMATHGPEGDKWGNMWAKSGIPALRLIEADEVIVCMDARTGRTLWEAVWPGKELNQVESYGGHNNICLANGKAYAIGNAGWAYCADARTGAKLWAAPLGTSHKIWASFMEKCIRESLKTSSPDLGKAVETPPDPPHVLGGSLNGTTYNVCPVVADGVMVSGEWAVTAQLTGLDGETGKQLWTFPGSGGIATPLLWRHKGREYVVSTIHGGGVVCLDPRSGKERWRCALGGPGTSLGIDGDYLLGPSVNPRETPPEKQEGWACYRMSPDRAEKVWALSAAAYGAGGYPAPTVHRGYAWMQFSRARGATGLTECDTGNGRAAMACADLATGQVVSEIGGLYISDVCPGPMAMGDRMFYQHDEAVWMMDLEPRKPRFLGSAPQPCNWCSSCSAADGFVYFRGAERLVVALDVRKPSHRPTPSVRHDDPAQAYFEMTLPAARFDRKDVRFCLRGRDGKFAQTWAQTVAPGYHYPDVLEAEGVSLKDGRLAGRAMAYLQAMKYDFLLDAEVAKDGTLKGTYQDLYPGVELQGTITGTARPPAHKNGKFTLSWDRAWCGGGAVGYDFKMYAYRADGVFTNVVFEPRIASCFDIKIGRIAWAFDGKTWTGTLTLTQKSVPYELTFEVGSKNNRLNGFVTVVRDGGAPRKFRAWGEVDVPGTETADPRNGVYRLWLDKSLPENPGMDTWFGMSEGRATSEETAAWVKQCAGLHVSDPTGLKVEGSRLTGVFKAVLNGDGYLLKDKNIRCEYRVDAEIKDGSVTGTFRGLFDKRDPRQGEIAAGLWRND